MPTGPEQVDGASRLLAGPAPWAGLAPERRRPIRLGAVVEALGAAGQRGSAPGSSAPSEPLSGWLRLLAPSVSVSTSNPAAVLVALFEEAGEARVVLTRRSSELRTHRGQVSLPGGRLDPGEDAAEAAVREAGEEIGLDAGAVEIVGWLHPLLTGSGESLVLPVVGTMARRPTLAPNPAEVARVFDVELAELVEEGVFQAAIWDPYEAWSQEEPAARTIWFFGLDGERVWGATARILHELALLSLGVEAVG